MANLLSARLLGAAIVYAALVTVGSPGPITAAGVLGTLAASVVLALVVKFAWQKASRILASRRTSSEPQSG